MLPLGGKARSAKGAPMSSNLLVKAARSGQFEALLKAVLPRIAADFEV